MLSLSAAASVVFAQAGGASDTRDPIFVGGYPSAEMSQRLKDELLFLNAVQTYLWALPALNNLRPQRPMSLVARRSLAESLPVPAGPSADTPLASYCGSPESSSATLAC
jgi:hypothetical protein